ncbi:MAG: hypothetical protein Q4E13_08515 [Clostridia bacterium]|nr:hypothetical protein [Clostridia bacterium]
MAIDLVTQYLPYVDELFATEAKAQLLTCQAFRWDGAHTVKIYKVGTSPMNDYGRTGAAEGLWSRYGEIKDLNATTETLPLRKDRSFTFTIDTLDMDETKQALDAASALARQLREVVVPETDTYVISQMATNAGTKPTAIALTADNIYEEIIKGSNVLDNAEAPEKDRVLVVTPDTYMILKQSKDVNMDTDVANNMRLRGVIGMVDGMPVIRVPAARVPEGFGFMIAHPNATVAPVKLADYRTHNNPPGISGVLVEGRIAYDAYVLENKAKAIYYQAIQTAANA